MGKVVKFNKDNNKHFLDDVVFLITMGKRCMNTWGDISIGYRKDTQEWVIFIDAKNFKQLEQL